MSHLSPVFLHFILDISFHFFFFFFFSSRRRHTRFDCDWSSDVCSSDLGAAGRRPGVHHEHDGSVEPLRDLSRRALLARADRKSTRLNSSHSQISYAVFCLKKKKLLLDYYLFFEVWFFTNF